MGLENANGKSATSCSLGVTIKFLPCVEQRFPDHSLHSDEVFTQLKILALCLQEERSCFRSLWHVTLNTSNPILRLTKLVSNLKYFANTLYFHNFYFLSFVCVHIHKDSTWSAPKTKYLQSRETGSVPEAGGEEQAEKLAWAFESMTISFSSLAPAYHLVIQWWFTASLLNQDSHWYPQPLTSESISILSTLSVKISPFPSHLIWWHAPCGSDQGSGKQLLI